MIERAKDVSRSYLASGVRLGAGLFTHDLGPRPDKPLFLYEHEDSRFSRRVREALTELDLDAYIYPSQVDSPYRQELIERGGKDEIPFLIDENNGRKVYGGCAITSHLLEHYSTAGFPWHMRGPLYWWGSRAATTIGRARRRYTPGPRPQEPLTLYSFEASPYCRLVREVLSDLQIVYLCINLGKRSPKRVAFRTEHGRIQVPYLIDPNTDVKMFESADIIEYLVKTYGK